MKVETRTIYTCEICGETSDTKRVIEACEARGSATPRFAIGDIVLPPVGIFGWYDGDSRWVSNDDRHHGKVPNWNSCYKFYYVVTALDLDVRDTHRVRYHVFTKAMKSTTGYSEGYTFDSGHVRMQRVEKPPKFVVDDSHDLIGSKTGRLL